MVLCIVAGIALGKVAPDFARTLDGMAIYVNDAPINQFRFRVISVLPKLKPSTPYALLRTGQLLKRLQSCRRPVTPLADDIDGSFAEFAEFVF